MPIYTGTVVKDKAAVHSTPSKDGGNKIGNPLKAGVSIVGDKFENGSDGKKWMHINKPMDGWVLTEDINYVDPEEDSSSVPNISTLPTTPIGQLITNTPIADTFTFSDNLYKVRSYAVAERM